MCDRNSRAPADVRLSQDGATLLVPYIGDGWRPAVFLEGLSWERAVPVYRLEPSGETRLKCR